VLVLGFGTVRGVTLTGIDLRWDVIIRDLGYVELIALSIGLGILVIILLNVHYNSWKY